MTEQEEEFVHFVSCIESLNNSWRILKIIKDSLPSPLTIPAFRFALIEYSKPYRKSRGTLKQIKLDESCIPSNLLSFHKKITNARDQIHAHSDLTVMDAKIYMHKRLATIVQNNITGGEDLEEIDQIINLLERTLENMYVKEKTLEASLPQQESAAQ